MPDLTQSLQGRDLGHLRIVAELWKIELNAPDARVGLQRLAPQLLNRVKLQAVIEALPEEARPALDNLLQNEGRLSWALFTRRYGGLREIGPARRDRERPYLDVNASPAEALWYRALVGRTFFDTDTGVEEFAYIPEDFLALMPPLEGRPVASLGRPASPLERAIPIPSHDHILDYACTLLAALRLGLSIDKLEFPDNSTSFSQNPIPPAVLQTMLSAAGLLDAAGLPLPEPSRAFLEASRAEALAQLTRAWMQSPAINELRLLPGISFEGEWQNDPLRARLAILDFLSTLPGSSPGAGSQESLYWSLGAFVAALRNEYPDFQRPAGDYDSWFIREINGGGFLRGFDNWDAVDGALVRYVITGPLFWLGIVDLAAPAPDFPVTAFRFTAWAKYLLAGQPPEGLAVEDASLAVRSDGRLRVPRLVPRPARYQLARFCAWEGEMDGEFLYRVTPASLERARSQGLKVAHLLSLLRRYAPSVPPVLLKAVERWEEHGSAARLEQVTILRLSSPDLLSAIRSSKAARFLGDPLGPTTIIVQSGAWQKVLSILAEMGYLGEANLEENNKSPE